MQILQLLFVIGAIAYAAYLVVNFVPTLLKSIANSDTKQSQENSKMTDTRTLVANSSASTLVIKAGAAKVSIQRADVTGIMAESNNPEEFEVTTTDGKLRIVEKSSSGSIVGLSQTVRGGRQTMSINGYRISGTAGANISFANGKITINGRTIDAPPGAQIEYTKDSILVNGKELTAENSEEVAPTKAKERNELLVILPLNAVDELQLYCKGQSEFTLAKFNGNKLTVEQSGQSELWARTIECQKVDFDLSGQSKAELEEVRSDSTTIDTSGQSELVIAELATKSLKTEASGQSEITVKNGSSDKTSASASGMSETRLSGNFQNASKDKSGMATIDIR